MFEKLENMMTVPMEKIRVNEDSLVFVLGKLNDVLSQHGLFCLLVKNLETLECEVDYRLVVFSGKIDGKFWDLCSFTYDAAWNLVLRCSCSLGMLGLDRIPAREELLVDDVSECVGKLFDSPHVVSQLRMMARSGRKSVLVNSEMRDLVAGREIVWDSEKRGEFGGRNGLLELSGWVLIQCDGGMLRIKRDVREGLVVPV